MDHRFVQPATRVFTCKSTSNLVVNVSQALSTYRDYVFQFVEMELGLLMPRTVTMETWMMEMDAPASVKFKPTIAAQKTQN